MEIIRDEDEKSVFLYPNKPSVSIPLLLVFIFLDSVFLEFGNFNCNILTKLVVIMESKKKNIDTQSSYKIADLRKLPVTPFLSEAANIMFLPAHHL
jgi:hypothetical protein